MEQTYWADILRQDHAMLFGELDALKKAEGDAQLPPWQTLRDVCARLSAGLLEHIRREEQFLGTGNRSLGAAASDESTRPSMHHYSDYRYLQVITRHITFENRPFLLNNRYQLLRDFLRKLHVHMDLQEEQLFPIIEQTMALQENL